MTLTTMTTTGAIGQTINFPLLCPDGEPHEIAPLFCPHSYPHDPDAKEGEEIIAGWLCIHCDATAMFDPWCLCRAKLSDTKEAG